MTLRAPRLYAIADSRTLGLWELPKVVRLWAEIGVQWVQLRIKGVSDLDLFRAVEACVEVAQEHGGPHLWLNDRADVASIFPLFGVHLGQTDLPPAAAREIVGGEKRIGFSTHDLEQIRLADEDEAVDVVAIGPVFATRSKIDPDPTIGLDGVSEARVMTSKPLVAIGGIDFSTARQVLEAGADSVAVIGALSGDDPAENARRMLALLEQEATADGIDTLEGSR